MMWCLVICIVFSNVFGVESAVYKETEELQNCNNLTKAVTPAICINEYKCYKHFRMNSYYFRKYTSKQSILHYKYKLGEMIKVTCDSSEDYSLLSLHYFEFDENNVTHRVNPVFEGSVGIAYIQLRGLNEKRISCEYVSAQDNSIHIYLTAKLRPIVTKAFDYAVNGVFLYRALDYDTIHEYYDNINDYYEKYPEHYEYQYYELEHLNVRISSNNNTNLNCSLEDVRMNISNSASSFHKFSVTLNKRDMPFDLTCESKKEVKLFNKKLTRKNIVTELITIDFVQGTCIFDPFIQGLSSSHILHKYINKNTTVIVYEYSSEEEDNGLDLTTSLINPFEIKFNHSEVEIVTNNRIEIGLQKYIYKNFKIKLCQNTVRTNITLIGMDALEPDTILVLYRENPTKTYQENVNYTSNENDPKDFASSRNGGCQTLPANKKNISNTTTCETLSETVNNTAEYHPEYSLNNKLTAIKGSEVQVVWWVIFTCVAALLAPTIAIFLNLCWFKYYKKKHVNASEETSLRMEQASRLSMTTDHHYETIPERVYYNTGLTTSLHTLQESDTLQAQPHPQPVDDREENTQNLHYETPYEF